MSENVRKGAKDIEKERKRAKKTWWFSLNLPCPVMYSTAVDMGKRGGHRGGREGCLQELPARVELD